jgi:hypothetical protein
MVNRKVICFDFVSKVLIGDNLASHISINVINACTNNNIRFVLLPPNSTHLTQPLDLCCFRPIKAAWRRILKKWKTKQRGPIRYFPVIAEIITQSSWS